MLILRQT